MFYYFSFKGIITMNKKFLVSVCLGFVLSACSQAVKTNVVEKEAVTQVGASSTETVDKNIYFNESNVNGEIVRQQPETAANNSATFIPEKATAVCNDGTFSMSLLNEACLNNGGVKLIITRHTAN